MNAAPLLLTCLTVVVIAALVALIDWRLRLFWGPRRSALKAVLLFYTLLSGLYQIAFVFQLPFLFSLIDGTAVLLCLFFLKPIARQWREYADRGRALFLLYPFLAYLFLVAVLAVPGWNWDGMIFHLPRPFLFLNEGTVYTPHYSDSRQVMWPMGADVLNYLFTRYGETFGAGFNQFAFYIASLIAVYSGVREKAGPVTALTLTFVAASLPVIVYGSTTEKNDMHVLFAFLMMWLAYRDFRESRRRCDLGLLLLAMAFGIGCKLTFLFFALFSLIAFGIDAWRCKPAGAFFEGPKISRAIWIPFLLSLPLIAQAHLFAYDWMAYGDIGGDAEFYQAFGNAPHTLSFFLQNFFKYQLPLFDFVLPLSLKGIPFVDTALSAFYNHTIGSWTGDVPWEYHYFPEEMRALFGPFGILLVWGIYSACFRRKTDFLARALGLVGLAWMIHCAWFYPWQPATPARYFAPPLIAGLIFFPFLQENQLLGRHRFVRGSCLALLAFCCLANYGKPLVAYDRKAIPWYSYAFTGRKFLYHGKYFLDNRMDIYARQLGEGKKVFVFARASDWVFPYYQYAGGAKVRLGNYRYGKKTWSRIDFNEYDLIVCNSPGCIQDWNMREGFEKMWENTPVPERGFPFMEKTAAFYRPRRP